MVSQWFTNGSGEQGPHRFDFGQLQEHVQGGKLPSKMDYGLTRFAWPTERFQLYVPGQKTQPSGILLGEGCPSFPDYKTAAGALLFGVDERRRWDLGSEIAVLQMARTGGWIDELEAHPTAVKIRLNGDDLPGTRLEVLADGRRFDRSISKRRVITIPFPNGLPTRLWILLSRGRDWLDERDFNEYRRLAATDHAPIELDLAEQVQNWIYQGESSTLEFKVGLSEAAENMLKTVVAFANAGGGVVLFGVTDDPVDIVGLDDTQTDNQRQDKLVNAIRNLVYPEPQYEISFCDVDHRHIGALIVKEGVQKPYCLRPGRPEYYLRRHSSTFRATSDEVRALFRTPPPQPSHASYFDPNDAGL